jgi:putative hydrolase
MQALMSIVEGYSNYVMKRVGRRILPTFDLIESRLAAREAQRTAAERLFLRLSGLELKLEQYRLGEAFAESVARERGMAFLQRLWERPENLPTLAELAHPQDWMARMEASDVPASR